MGKYIKKFDTHSDYEDFKLGGTMVKPNVSYCVAENEIHYNAKPYTLTPKQLVEYMHSFLSSFDEKFLIHKQEHTNINASIYANTCENKMARNLYGLYLDKKNLRYNNMQMLMDTLSMHYYKNNNSFFWFSIFPDLELNCIKFENGNNYVDATVYLYKTNETYNGNDVFYIHTYEISYADDDGTVENSISNILYGDNIVLLCPHNTYANFTIAYPDGNGGYTTTKSVTFTLTPSIEDGTLITNSEWINFGIPGLQDDDIDIRVDNAIIALRSDFRNWYNGDFDEFSVLDDIKIEVTKETYEIIKNPWAYIDEEEIFNGVEQ